MIDNKYVPSEDGITHINIYSKGKTEIGRFASNFAFSPFECEDGKFDSIEGYWYWLTINPSNPRRDELRKLYGFEAKRIGRELRGKDWNSDEEFKKKICNAIKIKFESNLKMFELLKAINLPLTHYYVFYGVVKTVNNGEWILNFLNELRK